MYEQKKKRRAQFVEELFDHYDVARFVRTGTSPRETEQNPRDPESLALDSWLGFEPSKILRV